MFDPAALTAIATSAVVALAPLLQKAAEKGAEEVGKSSVGLLLDRLKKRLAHAGAKEALEDLAQQPDDPDARGALKMQLRKAISADPSLAAFLEEWARESQASGATTQAANVHGDNNKTTQIVGSGNSVS